MRSFGQRPPSGQPPRRSGLPMALAVGFAISPPVAEKWAAAILLGRHGSSEAQTDLDPPRQAEGDASPESTAGQRVPRLPPAEAAASRLPDLQDVSRTRGRAAPNSGSVAT